MEKELSRTWADTPPAPRELYQKGACRLHPSLPPEGWFLGQGMGKVAHQARKVCRSCPLRQMCLEWAFEA